MRGRRRRRTSIAALALAAGCWLLGGCGAGGPDGDGGDARVGGSSAMAPVVDAYVEQYLAMFPGRATGAGDHRFDRQLEDLSPG